MSLHDSLFNDEKFSETIATKVAKKNLVWYLSLFILAACTLSVFGTIRFLKLTKSGFNPIENVEEIIQIEDEMNVYGFYDICKPFDVGDFVQYLIDVRVQHPHIVFAQAILESGNFESKLFKLNNNPFGMKKSYQRPKAAIDPDTNISYVKEYSYYPTWEHSILDYAIWQAGYARGLTEEKYYEKLNSSYAEETEYVKRLKIIINNSMSDKHTAHSMYKPYFQQLFDSQKRS